jgi:hypothetical protein
LAEQPGGQFTCVRLISLLLFTAVLTAQITTAAKVRVDTGKDLTNLQYRTYAWRSHPVYSKHRELLEVYATGIELVKNGVNDNLMKRGYQPTDGTPDFYVTFFLTGENRQDIDIVYNSGAYGWVDGWYSWGSNWYGGWTSTVTSNYIRGMLVLDIVDARTTELVWRAYCWDNVKDWKSRDRNIAQAVEKALKRFPSPR